MGGLPPDVCCADAPHCVHYGQVDPLDVVRRRLAADAAGTFGERVTVSADDLAALLNAQPDRMVTEAALREVLGEAVHVSFRKGTDCPQGDRIWRLIADMPDTDWRSFVAFLASGLAEMFGLPARGTTVDDEREDR